MVSRLPGQILIAGEQLRLRMHDEPGLIGDRRYHFKTYTCCMVGRDAVDWLVKSREATSRENAIKCMRLLQDNGVLHHGMYIFMHLVFTCKLYLVFIVTRVVQSGKIKEKFRFYEKSEEIRENEGKSRKHLLNERKFSIYNVTRVESTNITKHKTRTELSVNQNY